MKKIEKDADRRARGEDGREDQKIFFEASVDTEKHEDTDARIGNQPRDQSARGNHAVKEKLGDDNGGGTIGDQTDQRGNDGRENTGICRESGDLILSDQVNGNSGQKGEKENEKGDLQRVDQGGAENAFMTTAVFIFADCGNLFFADGFFAEAQNEIHSEADENAVKDLDTEDGKNSRGGDFFGDHDCEHFIRGGNEDCDQCPDGNDAARVKIGGRGGKTALGNRAEQSARKGPELTRARGEVSGFLRRFMLDPLQKKVCQK